MEIIAHKPIRFNRKHEETANETTKTASGTEKITFEFMQTYKPQKESKKKKQKKSKPALLDEVLCISSTVENPQAKKDEKEIAEIKKAFYDWLEKTKDMVIVLSDREDAKEVDTLIHEFQFTGSKAYIILPFYKSRYSSSGQKTIQKKFRQGFKNFKDGVFLTLTFDPKQYTLLEAWEHLSDAITRTMNSIKIDKKRDAKRHGKDSSPEYVWVIEVQENGYPHVHVFFPAVQYLLGKELIEKIWGAGFIKVQRMREGDIGRYMSKYMAKIERLDKLLPFLWYFKIRLYSMTRMVTLPKKKEKEKDYVLLGICRYGELEAFAWNNGISEIEFLGSKGCGITITSPPGPEIQFWIKNEVETPF